MDSDRHAHRLRFLTGKLESVHGRKGDFMDGPGDGGFFLIFLTML